MATTIRDRVLPAMQRARQIIDTIGFRRYHDVIIRVRTWSGARTGDGSATTSDLVISPTPKVRVVRTTQEVTPAGEVEVGDYIVSKITPRFFDEAAQVWGGYYPTAQLATPAAPTVTPQGTTGLTAYGYKVIPLKGTETCGEASARGLTSTGNATLDGTNFNRLTGYGVTGATSYLIYRVSSLGSPSTTGFIGETTATTFDDTGLAADGSAAVAPRLQVLVDSPNVETVIVMTGDDGVPFEKFLKSINIDRALGYTLVAGNRALTGG